MLEDIVSRYRLDDRVGIAFAYIKYDSPDSQQPLEIISAMIKQLCWSKDTIPRDLLDSFHEYDRNARPRNLDTTLSCFINVLRSYDQVFLIFDALDECEQNLRQRMLEIIKDMITQIPAAKIFVTSRRETDIVDAFTLLKTPRIEIAAHNVEADITRFVVDRVRHLIETRKLKIQDPLLEGRIIKNLTAQADGMFLWVNLQLENLCRQRSDRDIEEELFQLPQGLEATYQRLLGRISRQPKALKSLARKALMCVLYAIRPLEPEELVEAVAFEKSSSSGDSLKEYSIEVILESCSNLLIDENGWIKPIHFSVKEFLTHFLPAGDDTPKPTYLWDFHDGHTEMAKGCMAYMMLKLTAKGPCIDTYELSERTLEHPLLIYSSHFFDEHIHRVTSITPDLEEQLNILLCSQSRVLATILQLRRCRSEYSRHDEDDNVTTYSQVVNAITLVYSTKLFNLPHLRLGNTGWKSLEVPKYTLHEASSNGTIDAISQLVVELNCDINERDEHGNTPLYHAVKRGQTNAVMLLLKLGAHINVPGNNVLCLASENGFLDVVQILLKAGAEVNAQGGEFFTALHAAAYRGSLEIIQLLLGRGAEVNTQGGKYFTALQAAAAVFQGSIEVVQLLLNRGAEVNAEGGEYFTALQAAAAYQGSIEVVQLLLDRGAEVNAEGGKYFTALQAAAAASRGSIEVMQLLLDRGAEVNAQGGEYFTALHAAARRGSIEVIQLLLDRGAEVNAEGGKYFTALQAAAAYWGSIEVVQLLLDRGAEVNAQGGEYFTALHAAARRGSVEIIQLLLDRGAEVNTQGGEYFTALQAAVFRGSIEVIQLLLDRGAE
ncbi:MAG: hypothetical protein Q9187_005406, partial [Circinaria calcarea]